MNIIPQSTTPRTDAAVRLTIGAGFNMVYPSFARELETELAAMTARAEKAEAELANIANAKPDTWGDMSDSFQAWAQNRARHALAAMQARAEKAEAETKQLINAGVNN